MAPNPILYFDLKKTVGMDFSEVNELACKDYAEAWGESWVDQPVMLGSLEVAQVVGFKPDVRDGYVICGLVIEWSDQLSDTGVSNG
jgi:hypothetical protein